MDFVPEYEKLLSKYCGDNEIFSLIEQCILSDFGEREYIYNKYGRYPEQRDRLMKLKNDLIVQRNKLEKEAKGGKK